MSKQGENPINELLSQLSQSYRWYDRILNQLEQGKHDSKGLEHFGELVFSLNFMTQETGQHEKLYFDVTGRHSPHYESSMKKSIEISRYVINKIKEIKKNEIR